MLKLKQIVLLALLALTLTVAAQGQEFRGSLTGRVTDPNGAIVAGATVTIKNIGTNGENTVTTNDDGSFTFPLLQPGKYSLTVVGQGFNTATREDVEIRVADRITLDVQLQAAGVTGLVNVVATQALETGSVSTGSVLESKQISELPLTEGTAYQLATLAPGIAYTGNPQFTAPISNGNLAAFRSNSYANQIRWMDSRTMRLMRGRVTGGRGQNSRFKRAP